MSSFISGSLAVILIFGGMIFFHELGHFLFARFFGIGVKTFSLGFGPVLFSLKRGKTLYQVAALPLGGYVALVGESAGALIPEPFTEKESFALRPAWQRFFVIAAGAGFNLLLAWILCWGLLFANGEEVLLPEIGTIKADSPAALAGLQVGDKIVSVNGSSLSDWKQVRPLVQKSQGAALNIVIQRQGQEQRVALTPVSISQPTAVGTPAQGWAIGVTPAGKVETRQYSFATAAVQGVIKAKDMVVFTWQALLGLLKQDIPADQISGPIGIATVLYEQTERGASALIFLAALLSVNLGIMNILPIPVLDGGHLFFILVEGILRRPVPARVQEVAAMVGLGLLLCLIFFATYNDITRIF